MKKTIELNTVAEILKRNEIGKNVFDLTFEEAEGMFDGYLKSGFIDLPQEQVVIKLDAINSYLEKTGESKKDENAILNDLVPLELLAESKPYFTTNGNKEYYGMYLEFLSDCEEFGLQLEDKVTVFIKDGLIKDYFIKDNVVDISCVEDNEAVEVMTVDGVVDSMLSNKVFYFV